MSKPKQLYWIGPNDANGSPLEHFGGMAGVYEPIPARDLTEDETAALTEAQWECIDSPAGKRLYRRTSPTGSNGQTEASEKQSGQTTPSGDQTASGPSTAKSAEP